MDGSLACLAVYNAQVTGQTSTLVSRTTEHITSSWEVSVSISPVTGVSFKITGCINELLTRAIGWASACRAAFASLANKRINGVSKHWLPVCWSDFQFVHLTGRLSFWQSKALSRSLILLCNSETREKSSRKSRSELPRSAMLLVIQKVRKIPQQHTWYNIISLIW